MVEAVQEVSGVGIEPYRPIPLDCIVGLLANDLSNVVTLCLIF